VNNCVKSDKHFYPATFVFFGRKFGQLATLGIECVEPSGQAPGMIFSNIFHGSAVTGPSEKDLVYFGSQTEQNMRENDTVVLTPRPSAKAIFSPAWVRFGLILLRFFLMG
jgi:hypothetical protein